MMAASDPFSDQEQLAQDLLLLENLRSARKGFVDSICAASAHQDAELLARLRLESTYQIAEFYYSVRAWQINTADDLERLAQLHNQYVVELTEDAAKLHRLGLSKERALDAIMSGDIMPRLLQNWRDVPGAVDQSNLARFLVAVMSTETCRKVVVACSDAGFLKRERTAYGTILVTSNGTLETIFGNYLRKLRLCIRKDEVGKCAP